MALRSAAATLTYLGVAGWHFRAEPVSLLIDPYFTRLSYVRVALGPAIPDRALIARYTPSADAILISHPHYDHLMDTPEVARLTGAAIYASPQSCELLALGGVPAQQMRPIGPGDRLMLGDCEVEVYPSQHRLIFGRVPLAGALRAGLRPPLSARDYRLDQQFSFRVSAGNLRMLVASGLSHEPPVHADVLLVGADATRPQLSAILAATAPRLVFPNHWDDMFRPLARPPRPMPAPPTGLLPSLRRIDVEAFARTVRDLMPGTEVRVPPLFEPQPLPG